MRRFWLAYGACCICVARVLHGFSFLVVSKGISTLVAGVRYLKRSLWGHFTSASAIAWSLFAITDHSRRMLCTLQSVV